MDTDKHADRRDCKRRKQQYGMQTRGKGSMLFGAAHAGESLVKLRTKAAKKRRKDQ